VSRVLRRIAGRGGSTSERKAYARAVQLYPRRYDKAEKRSWPILTRCFVELSTAPETYIKTDSELFDGDWHEVIHVDTVAYKRIRQMVCRQGGSSERTLQFLRISLDVSNTSFTGKTMFLNTFRPSSAVTRPLLAARLPELFELCD
jgi:hypothetical protein